MTISVRGKFYVATLTKRGHPGYTDNGTEVVFEAVCNDETPENARFHRYTPQGQITMHVDNPDAEAVFEIGKEFYVDFSPVNSD